MSTLYQILGKQVKKKRQELNMTQKQLAQASGLHRTYIVGIETGKRNISVNNVEKLAKALKEKPAKLLTNRK